MEDEFVFLPVKSSWIPRAFAVYLKPSCSIATTVMLETSGTG